MEILIALIGTIINSLSTFYIMYLLNWVPVQTIGAVEILHILIASLIPAVFYLAIAAIYTIFGLISSSIMAMSRNKALILLGRTMVIVTAIVIVVFGLLFPLVLAYKGYVVLSTMKPNQPTQTLVITLIIAEGIVSLVAAIIRALKKREE